MLVFSWKSTHSLKIHGKIVKNWQKPKPFKIYRRKWFQIATMYLDCLHDTWVGLWKGGGAKLSKHPVLISVTLVIYLNILSQFFKIVSNFFFSQNIIKPHKTCRFHDSRLDHSSEKNDQSPARVVSYVLERCIYVCQQGSISWTSLAPV